MKKISIIKRLTNKITVIGYCLLVIGITTSCNDFLDIQPMNEVVLENYWKQKSQHPMVHIKVLDGEEFILRR